MKKKVITALMGAAILSSSAIAMEGKEEVTPPTGFRKKKHEKDFPGEEAKESSIKRVPTVDEFNEAIRNNKFLQSYEANQKMDPKEQDYLQQTLNYESSSFGSIIDRPLEGFKGNTLVIGGGKTLGEAAVMWTDKPRGRTDLTQLNRELNWLKENSKFYQVDGQILGSPDKFPTEEEKEEFRKIITAKIQSILDKYYTISIDEDESPDLLASITSAPDMSSIPDSFFEEVIFENVDTSVWLNPNIFSILERITKPGGTILLDGVMQPRLLVTAFAPTKWADQVNEQVKEELAGRYWGENDHRLFIKLKN